MNTVVLNLNPKLFKMIQRYAEIKGQSVEEWILRATEGSVRSDMCDLDFIGIKLGFSDHEIDEVYAEIFGVA